MCIYILHIYEHTTPWVHCIESRFEIWFGACHKPISFSTGPELGHPKSRSCCMMYHCCSGDLGCLVFWRMRMRRRMMRVIMMMMMMMRMMMRMMRRRMMKLSFSSMLAFIRIVKNVVTWSRSLHLDRLRGWTLPRSTLTCWKQTLFFLQGVSGLQWLWPSSSFVLLVIWQVFRHESCPTNDGGEPSLGDLSPLHRSFWIIDWVACDKVNPLVKPQPFTWGWRLHQETVIWCNIFC